MDTPSADGLPLKGKIVVPSTEVEKAEERLEKVRSHQAEKSARRPPPGASGAREDQQPVEFVHIKTPGRNYAVLQVPNSRKIVVHVPLLCANPRALPSVVHTL